MTTTHTQTEMEAVSSKVTRAEALLSNLVAEKDRWSHTSHSFDTQMRTLIGDCLLSAAFVTYCGAFDYRTRTALVEEWRTVLDTVGVAVRSELSLIDYLSKPADRLAWSACGLPNDDLCAENAIILERFNRFPLVVSAVTDTVQRLCHSWWC
jgi:dynein heavy chain 1, cytosolic